MTSEDVKTIALTVCGVLNTVARMRQWWQKKAPGVRSTRGRRSAARKRGQVKQAPA